MPYSGGKVNPKDTLWQSEPKKAMNTALVQGTSPRACRAPLARRYPRCTPTRGGVVG
jgi:hypothetical protein